MLVIAYFSSVLSRRMFLRSNAFCRGKNGFFEFNQVDFGVVFSPFMKEIIPAQDPRWQSSHESLSETNRYVGSSPACVLHFLSWLY